MPARAHEPDDVVLDSARDSWPRQHCPDDRVQITMRGRALALPSGFRAAGWAAAIAIAAQALLLLWAGQPSSRPLVGDEVMYWDVARRLAAGQPSGLDPLWPPATAPFGAARLLRIAPKPARLILTYAAYVLALSLVVHVKTRYRVQMLPVFYLSSALSLAMPGGRTAGAARTAPAVCAAALLLLAFGGAWLP